MAKKGGEPATRLYLWRHPEVTGHQDGRFYGSTDVGLSSEGSRQVEVMARSMARVGLDAIYCSTLERSRLTAAEICRAQAGCPAATALDELREMNLGVWEALTYGEIAERYPQELQARYRDLSDYRVAGGESLRDVEARVMPVLDRICRDHPGQSVCLVGHGAVNRVILVRMLGMPLANVFRLEQNYAHLNVVDVYPDSNPVIKVLNLAPDRPDEGLVYPGWLP